MTYNAATNAFILGLSASTPRYERVPQNDIRVGERTPVHACAWHPLAGGVEYYAEGVDPNQGDAQRLTILPDPRPTCPYGGYY